MNKEE